MNTVKCPHCGKEIDIFDESVYIPSVRQETRTFEPI